MKTYNGKVWLGIIVMLGSLVGRDCIPVLGSLGAEKLGDIMLGGLFPVHQNVNIIDKTSNPIQHNCTNFGITRLLQSLMMIEAVEAINNSSMLNNLSIGYKILDTCSDVTTALQHANVFMNKSSCGNATFNAVIGEYHSEISIAVARILNIPFMPQVSYGSTAGILSDKLRFPTFKRTVPDDDHQAQVIAGFLRDHNWTWIGLITTDGDYGRYAAERLEEHAKKLNIFVSYRVVLPDFLDDDKLHPKLNETIKQIESAPKVKVIVSFAKPHHMSCLFEQLSSKASGRFWIAGDSWATSVEVLKNRTLKEVGKILGISLYSENHTHFINYLDNLDLNPDSHPKNTILQHFLKAEGNKSHEKIRETLKKAVYPCSVFSVRMAVKSVANAIKDICSQKTCRGGFDIHHSELNDALAKTKFHEMFKFTESGDLDTGYNINLWEEDSSKNSNSTTLTLVGRYMINNNTLSFLNDEYKNRLEKMTNGVTSKCSETCPKGFKRSFFDGKPTCCYRCEECPAGTFSNTTDADECHKCSDKFWSVANSTSCSPQTPIFLSWKDHYCITIVVFACLGLLLTLIVMLIFLVKWSTPVVRAAGGPISILILLSLLGTFTSVILFGGKPTDIQCKTGQVLFGLSFTLCVSCILVRSLKILAVFKGDSTVKRVVQKIFLPYWIIGLCMIFQGIICGLWLWKKPPSVSQNSAKPSELVIQCDEGDLLFFGLMLALISLLAVVCFGFAFLGRKLPECYNEDKCISFSMLIYIISWVVFGPIYVNKSDTLKTKSALQMVVMLFSAFGILICHFIPKCFIILFKSKQNTRDHFKRKLQEFTRRFHRSSQELWHRNELDRPGSVLTMDSTMINIINRVHSNPYPTGSLSSFHISIENLPREVDGSEDSLYGSSLSSEEMNEEKQKKQSLSSSQKLIKRLKNKHPVHKRTLSLP